MGFNSGFKGLIIQLQYFLYKYCMWVDILRHTTEARDWVKV